MLTSEAPVFDLSDERLWIPAYAPVFRTRKKIILLYGSRNSGKSEVGAQKTLVRTLDPSIQTKGILVRKHDNKIRESQWNTLREIVSKYGWGEYFRFALSPLGIRCFNSNRLLAVGLNDPNGAKSIRNPNFCWIEEGDQLEEEDFRQLMFSIRGNDVQIVITTNPPKEGHWLLKRFFPGTIESDGTFTLDRSFERPDGLFTEVPSTDPDCLILHTCYKHNPFRGPDVDAMMERERLISEEAYRVNCLGLIGRNNNGSRWLKKFSYKEHVRKVEPDWDYPVHLTYDQNYLPYMTQIAIQCVPVVDDDGEEVTEIRIFREYCIPPPDNSSEELCAAFIAEYAEFDPYVFVCGEPGGDSNSARKTKNEAKHHYFVIMRELEDFNPTLRVSSSAPSIKGRQHFMEKVLDPGYNATGLRLVIDPSCRHMIGDLENLVEDENGGYVKKRIKDEETGQSWEERGHCMDALIYFFFQTYRKLYRKHARV